ncbi:MAG: hypothetical protein EZS28_039742, partial [Streblomastix strix]
EAKIAPGVATTLSYGANIPFPVPSAEATLPEERGSLARKALESACAMNQGRAGLIHDIARNKASNLVSKLCKIWDASLQTVGDTQRERESRLKGIQVAPDEQDVLSKTSRKKFKWRKSAKSVIGNWQPNRSFNKFGRFSSYQKGQRNVSFQGKGRNRIFTPVFKKDIKSCILNVSYFMQIIGQSNKFLQQANVRIEITSIVTNSQNGCEQSGIEGYDLGSLALKDQSRALGNLGSQCQEEQSYNMEAAQQQAQPCRPASWLTLELNDESRIISQSGKEDDFISIQANQQQKVGPNYLTDLRVGKYTVEQLNAIRLKETYKQTCRQAYINTSGSLGGNLEPRSAINRQNRITELLSGSTRYYYYLAYSSIRDYPNRGQVNPLYPSLITDWSLSIDPKGDQSLLDTPKVPRDIEKKQIEVQSNKIRGQFVSVGLINQLRSTRADCGKGNIRRSSLGESLFCNTQKRPWQMEKDNRLFDLEQISKNKPFHNGGYQYSKRDLVTQRLDDKDRSTICLPSYPSGSRVQTVSGVLPQESVLSIQSNVLWGKTCTTNIPQDVETSY